MAVHSEIMGDKEEIDKNFYSFGNVAGDERIGADVANETHVGDDVGGEEIVDGVGVWIKGGI